MWRVLISIVEALALAALAGIFAVLGWLAGERGQWGQVVLCVVVFGLTTMGELSAIADLVEWQHA
jgi:hypothetical protein